MRTGFAWDSPNNLARLSLAALIVAVFTVCGCRSHPMAPSPNAATITSASTAHDHQMLERRFSEITYRDGISSSEAMTIAEYHLAQHSVCGGATNVRDGSKYWIVDGAFGIAAKRMTLFRIDKKTGEICPSFRSPEKRHAVYE
jgi:hypothetical protein